ncbi:MAG: arginine deiminase family protein [Thermoanaerobaculia bacterium]
MFQFGRAVVRPPAESFAEGLSEAGLGEPDLERARAQHRAYCAALVELGVELVELPADPDFPDSTFVEDTAVVTAAGAIVTRPGAASRQGETAAIAEVLAGMGIETREIVEPGTVDGGDVCQVGHAVLIGISERTNMAGAAQLARHLADFGLRGTTVGIRGLGPSLLHLKSGLSALGDRRLAVVPELAGHPELGRFEQIVVDKRERYAANCVRVNDGVLVAAGFPRFAERLDELGYRPVLLEMSEFRKMDGGLSCLSLRLPGGGSP